MELKFRCEFCSKPIFASDYLPLAHLPAYKEGNVYIAHIACDDPAGDKILEVVETCGELKLVRVDEG